MSISSDSDYLIWHYIGKFHTCTLLPQSATILSMYLNEYLKMNKFLFCMLRTKKRCYKYTFNVIIFEVIRIVVLVRGQRKREIRSNNKVKKCFGRHFDYDAFVSHNRPSIFLLKVPTFLLPALHFQWQMT